MRVGGGSLRPGQRGPWAAQQCLASRVPVPGRAGGEVTLAQVQASRFDPNAKGLDQG